SSSAHSTPSNSGRWFASPTTFSEADSWSSIRDLRSNSGKLSRTLSVSSKHSEPERHVRFAEPAYSFVGMHCIFDNCKASVTVLQFGRTNSDLLAYGSSDGSLTVCQVSEPPSVLQKLTGHSKDITDFDFSSNNQYIASCSMDKTVRVWEISKGTCIRVVYGVSSQLCICFHPVNNNLLLVGNANREINVNFLPCRSYNLYTIVCFCICCLLAGPLINFLLCNNKKNDVCLFWYLSVKMMYLLSVK
uniref:Uncharacterized protein n=1 Tax=Aegilops tauschii subsp. strangulata TaxID=200361 RepID=A0A453FNJ9_AEGTS